MRRVVVVLLVLLGLGVASPADAMRWSAANSTVRVHVAAGHSWGVGRALRMWNHRHAGQPRLVRVHRDADVVVRVVHRPGEQWAGRTVYTRAGTTMTRARVELNAKFARPALRRTTSLHEFGHVLGLRHTRCRCSIMSPSYPWWNGGHIGAVDVRHLRRLY